MDLIYWKETERTGMVLTGLVVGLLSLFQLSIITVLSTVSLALMCFTISVRVYYHVLHAFKWGDGEHPFKAYLDMDISLSGEQADLYMQKVIVLTLSAVDTLKRLIFVGNVFDSIKLLVLMYLVTYLGDLCNGLTLLIISVIAVFSLPLFYRQRQVATRDSGFKLFLMIFIDTFDPPLIDTIRGGSNCQTTLIAEPQSTNFV
uniref:Reticulon n=1 Tax=Salarias fasciatus TaxID=181472 RepID=A0A672IP09_SALFA